MLHYNEHKINEGEAILILASGFAGDIGKMNFNQKLHRFEHLTELKPTVKTNAVHISLNFHSSEDIAVPKLQQIAAAYMDKIGFGDQPFLVYRHDDAAHTHVHIVTTSITAQGSSIDLHNIGVKLSEPARKAIEQDFNLIRAESKAFKQEAGIKPIDPSKVSYGKLPTKRAINNVVTAVTRDYKYTSLAELNAVLKGFNVVAQRGEEHTPMFQNKGLMFSLLDADGKTIGVPIKSSAFYAKPTLRNLEKKFGRNTEKRKPHKESLKQRIDLVLNSGKALNKQVLETELKRSAVQVLFRQNDQGLIYGLTFVDHRNKVVFNGSDLGKAYSAKAITERFSSSLDQGKRTYLKPQQANTYLPQKDLAQSYLTPQPTGLMEVLLGKTDQETTTGLPRRRKRKKRKGMSQDNSLTL